MNLTDILKSFRSAPPPDEANAALSNVLKQYPAFSKQGWKVGYGQTNDNRQLEYYPPDEQTNPNKGNPYLEIYNKGLHGPDLERALYGDMLHYQPSVNPQYEAMRQQFAGTFTPQQNEFNKRRYQESVADGETRPFNQWMNQSHLDAYVRGYLAPDAADEWRKQGVYTPQQEQILQGMMKHLAGQ